MVEMKEEVVEKQSEAKAWAVASRIKSKANKLGAPIAGLASDTPDDEQTPGEFSSPMFETEQTNGQG